MINEINGVKFITFDIYNKLDFVKCIFTTRIGGVSKDHCDSLNLSFAKDSSKENVYENFKRVAESAGLNTEGITFSSQYHNTNIMNVTNEHKGMGFLHDSHLKDIDGLMTNEKNIVLTTFYADCVPLYLVDPVKKAIASSHAGWKGTLNNMVSSTVQAMVNQYDTDPKDLLCAIGPSIHKCCFEVDAPVANEFLQKDSCFDEYIVKDEKRNKYFIDLQGINKMQMINAGILPQNIEVSPLCTKCNDDLFFSHRNMGDKRGSMAAMMEIVER